jgi:D-arabinose 1-dehydrogenase-like Zn-dependent alcohol dehydrogenase
LERAGGEGAAERWPIGFYHLGGVGRSAMQIARLRGANVVGSCSASGRDEALELGVGEVVDYRAFDIDSHRSRFDVVLPARCRCANAAQC